MPDFIPLGRIVTKVIHNCKLCSNVTPGGPEPTKFSNQLHMATYRCQERQSHFLHHGNNTPWQTGPHFVIFADQYLIPELTADRQKILPKTWLISCMTLMWYQGRTIENITNWTIFTTVLPRISNMIGTLKCPYPGLTTDTTSEILGQIQSSIRQKVRIVLNERQIWNPLIITISDVVLWIF